MSSTKRKTIVYIDGFNLFHALKEMHWKKYYWLDISAFSLNLLNGVQTLLAVKYFTSRVTSDPNEQKRQNTYLEALETLKNVEIQYGKFTSDQWECFRCHRRYPIYHEKQTDVNLAVSLIGDAQEDYFDDAIIISADSDQARTMEYVRKTYPYKMVTIGFPPGRSSADLSPLPNKVLHLGSTHFSSTQLPEELPSKTGFVLKRPHSWRW
jgi:NYN domain-containing protein